MTHFVFIEFSLNFDLFSDIIIEKFQLNFCKLAMPVKVLPQPPEAVEKPALSHGHGDNNYRERYHDDREQGELVDNRIYVGIQEKNV